MSVQNQEIRKRLNEVAERMGYHSFGSPEYRRLLAERRRLAALLARQKR